VEKGKSPKKTSRGSKVFGDSQDGKRVEQTGGDERRMVVSEKDGNRGGGGK